MKFSIKLLFQSILLGISLCLWSIISSYLTSKLTGISLGNRNNINTDFKSFSLVVFIAPFLETLIFQWLIIYQTYESCEKGNKKELSIILSSVLFGLSHFYNICYLMSAIGAGILLATSFCHFREKSSWLSAIFYVTIIHSFSNLLIFVMKFFIF